MSWEKQQEKQKQLSRKCREIARTHFPKDEYEIKKVYAYIVGDKEKCVIDFKRKGYEAEVDCEDYCSFIVEEPLYKECVENCKHSKELAEIGSMELELDKDIRVKEATIPGSCEYVWCGEFEDPEEFEKKLKDLEKAFKEIGCDVNTGWIHPHEITGTGEVEEYPAICYYHPSAKDKGCKLEDVLKAIKKL
jgi:hypothetical protein